MRITSAVSPALALAFAALGAAALTSSRSPPEGQPPPAGTAADRSPAFREPPSVSSRGGVLRATLRATRSRIEIGSQPVVTEVYDGSYIPPTLRARPGDVIRLQLVNQLDEPTNLHTHGLHVSPQGNSDNIFLMVEPGQTQAYEFRIPAHHPPGMFWYHPHAHHFSNTQVEHGMAGALIVEGLLDPFPTLRDVEERILLLKDIQLEDGKVVQRSIGVGTTRTINGLVNPTLPLRPGETQLWRIGNLSANLYYRLRLDGHQFYPVARDGNRFARIVPTDGLFIPPGGRMEVLVQAGAPGVYPLRTLAMNTGPAGNKYPAAVLATARVEGDTVAPRSIPTTLLPVVDLRGKVTGRRTVVFSETPDGDVQMIDGKTFDPSRIDTRVQLGAVEEWTIRNESDELHDFHIHQGGFQLVEVNGKPQPLDAYYDTVNLPIRGEIKIIIPFTDSLTAGKFVYHCHLLAHEDKGMMATIEVAPTTGGAPR